MKSVKTLLKRPYNWIVIAFCVIFVVLFIFTFFNAKFYDTPIGQITQINNTSTTHISDEHHNKDTKHKTQLHIKILNGKFEGKTANISHEYTESQADSEAFSKNNKVLLHIDKDLNDAYITEKKRDSLVVAITGIFLLTVLLVGKKIGLQSILSLALNTLVVLLAIYIHNQSPNISLFGLMSVGIFISTTLTLLLVTGWQWRTLITILSTLVGTFLCVGMSQLIIQLTGGTGLKFETMSFLTLPPKEVFLASVMIGTLGAVMDVAITIASGMAEILRRTPDISMKRWALAGRNIGQDIMGTMTNILLFSYLSGSLPMLLIYLKNANTITYTISMNWSLEISRAITGGIGIVLTIPITILLMQLWFRLRGVRS
ncbi:YibE/F family protein [Staphylococcus edaphicus]|uniref:YibE/F family protein n=1 Tax=Staphylococcus edaphicus TaxID=1955013 RepID=A0A2C6WLQ7_9STAP|nr:YibE/F family protein [Staphylococcus edaphicus]PHK49015.1 YibE/F-like protein [Staphylococcus edaphicus]UQW81340.1 YibE/F family protein [Staphylococcus edaphicus]